MKRTLGILMGLVLIAVPVIAFACSATLVVSDNECGPVTVTGTYTDDDRLFKGVRIFVDGAKVAENGAWSWAEMMEYEISASYTIAAPGDYAVVVKGYDRVAMVVVDKTFTQVVTVSECVPDVIPTPEPPPYCKPYNVGTWYECNTGNSTYTATSADKCWCQGLTGRVHYHTTYDCGKSYVTEGSWDDAPDSLGYYLAPCCTAE